MRQVVLDTETTGLSVKNADRIIEIGCVEIIDRVITGKVFHSYCDPERKVGEHTISITGIKDEFLLNQPKFSMIVADLLNFIDNAELVIHNASFDLEFINYELSLINHQITDLAKNCKIIDTLGLARSIHPGQRNNLDSLSKRYNIDIDREFHGALLDANILARVYLKMTAGQINLNFGTVPPTKANLSITKEFNNFSNASNCFDLSSNLRDTFKIIYADQTESRLHEQYLKELSADQ